MDVKEFKQLCALLSIETKNTTSREIKAALAALRKKEKQAKENAEWAAAVGRVERWKRR